MPACRLWLDGRFSENVEMTERRNPRNVDVVTFFNCQQGKIKRLFSQKPPSSSISIMSRKPIKGKIGSAIKAPDMINNDGLKQNAHITLDVIQVGQGRPRFTLNAFACDASTE